MATAPKPAPKRPPAPGTWFDNSPSRMSYRWFHRDSEGKSVSHPIGKKKQFSYEHAHDIYVTESWVYATHPPSDATFGQMWDRYLLRVAQEDKSVQHDFKYQGKHILDGIGRSTLVREIDFAFLERFQAETIVAGSESQNVRKKRKSVANRVLDYCEANDIVKADGTPWRNHLHKLRLPLARKINKKGWTPDAPLARALCFEAELPFDLCWKLSCCCSVGPAELFGLTKECLVLDDEEKLVFGWVIARRSMLVCADWNNNRLKPTKNQDRWHVIAIPDCLIRPLRAWMAADRFQDPSSPVFGRQDRIGSRPHSRDDYRRALISAAGKIPGNPHVEPYGGRRFFATACEKISKPRKVPMIDRQIIMGHHSGFRMTAHYTTHDVETRRWIPNAIAKLLGLC